MRSPRPDSPPPRGRLRGLAVLPAAALVALALLGLWRWWDRDLPPKGQGPAAAAADPLAVLPLSPSPYLNTGPDARYVGSAACRECHAGRHGSFRTTGMGRSMAEVDPALAPPDAAFDHPPSKRRYQIVRKGGELWHRELLLTAEPGEVVLAEYPLRYVVGSGRHSLTYLAEAEGFLVESPVTWYASRKAWGMSPGYDSPHQGGFDRATGEGCLFCHAGQAEAVGSSLHKMRVPEAAIGCERCHGPGSLHAERHAGKGGEMTGKADLTIVNPARLSRDLAEAVCQQCHLRSSATIVARGRKPSDFRPGLPLQDFRHDYALEEPGTPMTVVGHVEQMHLSRCYSASGTLTCLTCHDPHGTAGPSRRKADYKAVCLDCHRPERCTAPAVRRLKESPANDCVHCHMPRSPTEIPHLAFTHHRIGVHDGKNAPGPDRAARGPGVLRPFLELSRLGAADRDRSLGMGYLEVANREREVGRADVYRQRALELMSAARDAGLRDSALDASLARLRFDLGRGDVVALAESARADPGLVGQDRCNALFLLAEARAGQGRYEEATAALRELEGLRRHPVDWLLRADCERVLGRSPVPALESAVRIDPRLAKVHQFLADHYRRQGDLQRAAWHQARAVP